MASEAQPGAEGEAEEPVGGEVAEHGSARVAGAAKSARGDSLDAVEELEGGARCEKSDGTANDNFVVAINTGDVARENEKNDAHRSHEGRTEDDGRVASVASVDGGATADGLANTDSSGSGEAEGNHVSEGDRVEGDLVAGLSDGAEASDEGSDEGEDRDLGGLLNRRRDSKKNEFADAVKIGLQRGVEQLGFVFAVVPQ